MAVRLDSLSVLLLPDSDENASSSESLLSEAKEFPLVKLDELPAPLSERKLTTPRSSPLTARKPTTPRPSPLEIKPDEELQRAIAKARDFASKATPLKARSSKPSGLSLEKKETEVKTTALKLSRAAAAVEKKETEEKTPTATPRAPTLDLKEAKTDAVPLEKLPIPALTGKLLFHHTIVKLGAKLEPILKDKSDETGQESDKIIKESDFYAHLKEFPTEQNFGVKEHLLLTILELNEHCRHKPDDQGLLTNAILGTLRLLFREGEWQLADGGQFFGQLYHMHTLHYGNRGFTPVLEVIDRGMAAEYLTPKSQKFMDDVTYDDQFEPITEILKKVDGDISDPKTKAAIAAVADNLFTRAVKKNHFVMSHNLHKAPIQGIPLINKTGIARGLAGAGEFQKIAILHKYNYMKDYLALHLSYIAKAKKEHLQAGSAMRYFEKKTRISGEQCTVAFGGVGEQSATKIKAISVTSAYQEEVYFFVEELEEETPKAPPNPKIPLMHRPLYKFELIPGTHYIRLQEASSEVREEILKALGEIKEESKIDVKCGVKTAIWHHKELMLVEIIRQCGSMLSSRALYGAIKTYVKNLPRPTKGELSDPTAFKAFKKKLLEVLIGAYVLVMNETLDSWYQDDIYEEFNSEISRGIIETGVMKIIKKITLEVFNNHKHPGKHLLKSIMSCCYDGDPQAFTSEI